MASAPSARSGSTRSDSSSLPLTSTSNPKPSGAASSLDEDAASTLAKDGHDERKDESMRCASAAGDSGKCGVCAGCRCGCAHQQDRSAQLVGEPPQAHVVGGRRASGSSEVFAE